LLAATGLELIVRDLRPDDWAEVAAIYRDGMRGGMATFETEMPQWDAWHEAHPLRVVAEIDEQVLGWAALGRVSSRWAYRGVGETSVYIAHDARGKGLGKTLMEAQSMLQGAGFANTVTVVTSGQKNKVQGQNPDQTECKPLGSIVQIVYRGNT